MMMRKGHDSPLLINLNGVAGVYMKVTVSLGVMAGHKSLKEYRTRGLWAS